VCPIRPLHVADAGLLLWTRLTKDIDRLLHGRRAGRQQQTRRSSVRRLDARAFQFGQKKFRFDSIRFSLPNRFFRFDSIRQSDKFAASTLIVMMVSLVKGLAASLHAVVHSVPCQYQLNDFQQVKNV